MEFCHCEEYEHLTMEEKLLVDMRMKEFFSDTLIKDIFWPNNYHRYIIKRTERAAITKLRKEKNGRQTGERNACRRNHE